MQEVPRPERLEPPPGCFTEPFQWSGSGSPAKRGKYDAVGRDRNHPCAQEDWLAPRVAFFLPAGAGVVVAAWKAFFCYKGVMVINGMLSDVTRVSNEVTEEVIVTAVEAGESVRRVVQILILVIAGLAGLMVASACSSAWNTISIVYYKWRCSMYWWQGSWSDVLRTVLYMKDEGQNEQERAEPRPRIPEGCGLADQENGGSENPRSPRPTRRPSGTSSWSSPEGGSGSSSEARSLAAIRRINQMVEGPRVPPLREGSSPSSSPPVYMESLYSEIGRESSTGVRSPVQEFLAARRLKSERKAARSKASGPPPARGQTRDGSCVP